MGNTQLVAHRIVERVVADLRDRRGFRHLLESIELEDSDTYQEIMDTLLKIVLAELDNHVVY